ncbi:MAG: hypothetical protein EXR50_01625 [Dehalococcoidia bacterium]|nr:hypothetical protein [Dehalococcoidia bacterium]
MFKGRLCEGLAGVAAALLMLLVIAGCGPAAQPSQPSETTQEQKPESSGKAIVEVAKERGGKLVMSGASLATPTTRISLSQAQLGITHRRQQMVF